MLEHPIISLKQKFFHAQKNPFDRFSIKKWKFTPSNSKSILIQKLIQDKQDSVT